MAAEKKLVWNTQSVVAFSVLIVGSVVCFALKLNDPGWAMLTFAGGIAALPRLAQRVPVKGGDNEAE